jgi:hypothetical protein
MAQPINCDICQAEHAVQMLTDLQDGSVLALGPGCLPMFYGHGVLAAMDAGDHKGVPSKCQACRRVHERMTTPVTPIGVDVPADPPEIDGQMSIDDAAAAP